MKISRKASAAEGCSDGATVPRSSSPSPSPSTAVVVAAARLRACSMISFSCASFCAVMRFFGAPAGREKSSVRGGGGSSSESPPRSRAGGGAAAAACSRTDARSSASRSCDSSRMRCASRARSRSKRFSSVFWSLGRARRSRRSRRSSPLVISLTSATMASARRRSSASASGGTSATAGRGLGLPMLARAASASTFSVRACGERAHLHSGLCGWLFDSSRARLTLPARSGDDPRVRSAALLPLMCRGRCRGRESAGGVVEPARSEAASVPLSSTYFCVRIDLRARQDALGAIHHHPPNKASHHHANITTPHPSIPIHLHPSTRSRSHLIRVRSSKKRCGAGLLLIHRQSRLDAQAAPASVSPNETQKGASPTPSMHPKPGRQSPGVKHEG